MRDHPRINNDERNNDGFQSIWPDILIEIQSEIARGYTTSGKMSSISLDSKHD